MEPDELLTITIRKSTLYALMPVIMCVPNVGGIMSYLRAGDAADQAQEAKANAAEARDMTVEVDGKAEAALDFAIDEDAVCRQWMVRRVMESAKVIRGEGEDEARTEE